MDINTMDPGDLAYNVSLDNRNGISSLESRVRSLEQEIDRLKTDNASETRKLRLQIERLDAEFRYHNKPESFR